MRNECAPYKLHIWEVIFAVAFAVYIGGAAVQAAAKGVGVAEFYWDDFEAEFIELVLLIDFGCFDADGFWIEREDVHRQPC